MLVLGSKSEWSSRFFKRRSRHYLGQGEHKRSVLSPSCGGTLVGRWRKLNVERSEFLHLASLRLMTTQRWKEYPLSRSCLPSELCVPTAVVGWLSQTFPATSGYQLPQDSFREGTMVDGRCDVHSGHSQPDQQPNASWMLLLPGCDDIFGQTLGPPSVLPCGGRCSQFQRLFKNGKAMMLASVDSRFTYMVPSFLDFVGILSIESAF